MAVERHNLSLLAIVEAKLAPALRILVDVESDADVLEHEKVFLCILPQGVSRAIGF